MSENKEITFRFDRMDFSFVDRKEERVAEPGEFMLMIGRSSKDKDSLKMTFIL